MLRVYKASAGSGKTYALTRQYLLMLLGKRDPDTGRWHLRKGPDGSHRHILAITFTNKATEEMARRIVTELAVIAGREPGQTKPSPYLNDFCREMDCTPRQLTDLASDMLDDLLGDYAFFHVSTIDAFFQTVLRTFAREVEVPDNFELELSDDNTIAMGVSALFSSINRAPSSDPEAQARRRWLESWFVNYMAQQFDSGRASNLLSRKSSLYREFIGSFSRLMDETFRDNSAQIEDYLADQRRLEAFERGIKARLESLAVALIADARRLQEHQLFRYINNHNAKRILAWADGERLVLSSSVRTGYQKWFDDPTSIFNKSLGKQGIPDDFMQLTMRVVRGIYDYDSMRIENKHLRTGVDTLGLLGALLGHIHAFCRDNNLVLLSETNSLLQRIINNDDTPFVYERLGYYLEHYLIDEFQDTSRMQWQNMKPLLNESLSHCHTNLIIGDEKQCIYRFRNSDPDLLGSEVERQVAPVAVEGMTIEENNNWRSSHEVVRFNNSIFHAMSLLMDCYDTYANVIQQISEQRDKVVAGHVTLMFEPDAPEAPAEAPSLAATPAADGSDSPEADDESPFCIEQTVKGVDRLLRQGYAPSDIAIITRTHAEGARVIKALMEAQKRQDWTHGPLEVTSSDSIGIASSPAVRMIIEVLRLTQMPQMIKSDRSRGLGKPDYVDRPNPAFLRTRLIYYYEYYLRMPIDDASGPRMPHPGEALALALDHLRDTDGSDSDVADGIEQFLTIADPNDSGAHRSKVVCSTLTSIVDRIIARFIPPETLHAETAYLNAFQDLVYEFSERGNSDIRNFLHWWDNNGHSQKLASTESTEAIKVMTIHQSKGLEFPCVIIPYAKWETTSYDAPATHNVPWFALDPNSFPGIAPEVVPPWIPLPFKAELAQIDRFADSCLLIKRQQAIDAMNICYVAFTRAINELLVICPKPGRKNKDNNIGALLRNIAHDFDAAFIASDVTLDEASRQWVLPLADMMTGDVIEIGKPTHKTTSQTRQPEPTYDLPDYDPNVNTRLITLSVSDINVFDYSDPRQRGNFLHAIMCRVRQRDDLDMTLRRAAYRAHLTAEQHDELHRRLSAAMADPRVAPWFDDCRRIVTERPLIDTDRDVRRPDRIVWTADGHIDVIDYKFGAIHPSYHTQVRRYVERLQRAGYTNVRGYLWAPFDGLILSVT